MPFFSSRVKPFVNFIAVLLIASVTSVPAVTVILGKPIQLVMTAPFFGNIPVRIDALSSWFILIINLTCVNGALYGIGYMKPYLENAAGIPGRQANLSLHWVLFLIFQVSMLGVCMIQHGLAFLVAWEMMSISSLLLVMFEHYRSDTAKAGINYLVQMHIAVVLLSIAFIWVHFSEGSFDFNAIASFFSHHNTEWLFLLFFLGFGIKAGFIPLHTWLPHAHPAAPSHISGVMSGVIVKLGIYGILRIITYLDTGLLTLGAAVLILSVLTTFYGIQNAAIHRDFKRILAFCTIENIGIIGIGTGIGMIGKGTGNHFLMFIGFTGALLHVLNHSLYKSLLFFSAGNVYRQTHTRNIEHLGGLIKKMPDTAFFFLTGALAIGGLPPFNGFVSEFLIYSGLFEGIRSDNVQLSSLMILCISGLAMAGSISVLTFTKSFGTIFLGSARTELQRQPEEVPLLMRIPMYFIVSLMLFIGIFPDFVLLPAASVVTVFDASIPYGEFILAPLQTLAIAGRVSLLLLILICLVYLLRTGIRARKSSACFSTWGCGYVAPNVKMQYTGKSFSKALAKLFSFITAEKKKYHELEAGVIFPGKRKYHSHYIDFFEARIIDKATHSILSFLNYFSFIHNGKIQMYVLYGFFFIAGLIMATFFNLL